MSNEIVRYVVFSEVMDKHVKVIFYLKQYMQQDAVLTFFVIKLKKSTYYILSEILYFF